MLFALSAASALLDGLQSLTSSQSASGSSTSANPNGTPFDPLAGLPSSDGTGTSAASAGGSKISPQTFSALLDAQGQSGSTGSIGMTGSSDGSDSDPLLQALDAASNSPYGQMQQMMQQQAGAMQAGSMLSMAA